MTGVTIDHLVSTTAFMAALLIFLGLFTQTLQAAILYQENRHVALKGSDLLDNILLSPGYPYYWGDPDTSNGNLSCFGLQQPGDSGYSLSSFALMRLVSSSGGRVYYNRTGEWYSNISYGDGGGYLLVPVSESIDYATAAKLLGVNGSYGFELNIKPTITVSISEIQLNPLKLEVEVEGPGYPLKGASIDYSLYWVYGKDPEEGTPIFHYTSGSETTSATGLVLLDFSADPEVDGSKTYMILVHARLGSLYGSGYKSRETVTSAGNIIPFVESYENGSILLAHKWGKNDPDGNQGALHFNATFYTLSSSFEPTRVELQDSTGVVNYGQGKPYHRIQIPVLSRGFLLVTYCKGNEYGAVWMPWGIGTMSVSIQFGGNPANNVWTAADLRQVMVHKMTYQAKIVCWSLRGYHVWNPVGWW